MFYFLEQYISSHRPKSLEPKPNKQFKKMRRQTIRFDCDQVQISTLNSWSQPKQKKVDLKRKKKVTCITKNFTSKIFNIGTSKAASVKTYQNSSKEHKSIEQTFDKQQQRKQMLLGESTLNYYINRTKQNETVKRQTSKSNQSFPIRNNRRKGSQRIARSANISKTFYKVQSMFSFKQLIQCHQQSIAFGIVNLETKKFCTDLKIEGTEETWFHKDFRKRNVEQFRKISKVLNNYQNDLDFSLFLCFFGEGSLKFFIWVGKPMKHTDRSNLMHRMLKKLNSINTESGVKIFNEGEKIKMLDWKGILSFFTFKQANESQTEYRSSKIKKMTLFGAAANQENFENWSLKL